MGLRLLFFLDLGALVPASSSLFLSIESSFVLEFLAPAGLGPSNSMTLDLGLDPGSKYSAEVQEQ